MCQPQINHIQDWIILLVSLVEDLGAVFFLNAETHSPFWLFFMFFFLPFASSVASTVAQVFLGVP